MKHGGLLGEGSTQGRRHSDSGGVLTESLRLQLLPSLVRAVEPCRIWCDDDRAM